MTVGERFIKYLDDNPQASVQVVEGKLTKSMIFDGALLVKTSEITYVKIGDDVFETHASFYDKIFDLLQQLPLKS